MNTANARLPRGFSIFPRRLLAEQGFFAAMVWAGFSLFMLALPWVVSLFRPIEISTWVFGQSIAQWYVLAISCYVGWQVLELHVTHGRSRQGFLKSAFIFIVLFSAIVAALVAITYWPEALLYNVAGWPQAVDESRLYDGPLESHLVFLHGWLIFALYGAAGLFLGVAWYRSSFIGGVGIPFAFALSWVADLGMASTDGPLQFLVREGVVPGEPDALLATLLHVLCVGIFFVATWYCGRDVPIRKKAA